MKRWRAVNRLFWPSMAGPLMQPPSQAISSTMQADSSPARMPRNTAAQASNPEVVMIWLVRMSVSIWAVPTRPPSTGKSRALARGVTGGAVRPRAAIPGLASHSASSVKVRAASTAPPPAPRASPASWRYRADKDDQGVGAVALVEDAAVGHHGRDQRRQVGQQIRVVALDEIDDHGAGGGDHRPALVMFLYVMPVGVADHLGAVGRLAGGGEAQAS
jgi:hypothetical protein